MSNESYTRREALRLARDAAVVAATAGALGGAVATPATAAPTRGAWLIGEACQPFDCAERQIELGVCPPDPEVTAQLKDRLSSGLVPTKVTMRQAYVANARRGDLFLCPGNGTSDLGGLLRQLDHPRRYTHMGIFVDDGYSIRHCTASTARLRRHPDGELLSQPAPIHGFAEAALRWGWPGTLTQTVEDAWNPPEHSKVSVFQDGSGAEFTIDALSFARVRDSAGMHPCLVVRPCQDGTRVRDVLHTVASAAQRINGHYRFYGYTKGDIALEPGMWGPPLQVLREGPLGWQDQNHEWYRDGPCDPVLRPVEQTVPLICSTLPWYAVELVNQGRVTSRSAHDFDRRYHIILDMNEGADNRCARVEAGPSEAHLVDGDTRNGLIVFRDAERTRAANWFYDRLSTGAQEEVSLQVPSWLELMGYSGIPIGVILAIFQGGDVSLLTMGLGLPPAMAAEIASAGERLGRAVGNQIVNAFANDECGVDGAESAAWGAPGLGRTVSPDDIVWFWSRHQGIEPDGTVKGLYGSNIPAAIRMRREVVEYEAEWRAVPGYGGVNGRVLRRVGGVLVPVPGAVVTFACQTFTSANDGTFTQLRDVPGGIYLVHAFWTDPVSGYVWNIAEARPVDILIEPGKVTAIDIELIPPPIDFRKIWIQAKLDVVDRTLVGHDHWGHLEANADDSLGPMYQAHPHSYNPELPPTDKANEGKRSVKRFDTTGGDAKCECTVTTLWHDDFRLSVTVESRLYDGDDETASHVDEFDLPGLAGRDLDVSLKGGGADVKRGWITLSLMNFQEA